MRGLRTLALTLACTLATSPVLAAQKPTSSATNQADIAQSKALISFQRDLVSVLAPSADALPLLGAALLARPLPDQPKINSFHSLIARAAQAPNSDIGAAVSWARLADCDAKADACPNTNAMNQLATQAPDNAAVWLLKLGQDVRDMKQKDARDDLSKAAAAKLYDDYTGISLKALSSTVSTLPPPADTIPPGSPGGASGVLAMIVFGTGAMQPQPGLRATAELCDHAADDAAIKSDCLALGKTLEWGSSPLARSLGLHLRETLNADPAQQEDARHARLNLIWQVQNFAELSARAQSEPAVAQHLLTLARTGGTQMSLLLAALRDYNIPTDAPANWQPHKAE
ncbi:MAG: hypothetical protein WA777_17520 [Rhodanobacter sp.]